MLSGNFILKIASLLDDNDLDVQHKALDTFAALLRHGQSSCLLVFGFG